MSAQQQMLFEVADPRHKASATSAQQQMLFEVADPRHKASATSAWATTNDGSKQWRTTRALLDETTPLEESFSTLSTWTWVHNLGFNVPVDAIDSDGNKLICDISYPDVNTVVAVHTFAISGKFITR